MPQNKKPMTKAPQVSWRDLLVLLSPAGQKELVDFVHQAQNDRGANWLPEIRAEYPTFSWIVELVATKTAEEAFAELQAEFPTWPLWMVKTQLINLHALLKSEIERKR